MFAPAAAAPQATPGSPSWQDLDVGGERARLDDPAVALGEELLPERHVVPEGGVHEPRVLRHIRHRHFAGGVRAENVKVSGKCISYTVQE